MTSDILKKIIKFCLCSALFTPLFVSGDFVFPYVFPKTALFQIFVEIALAFWLLLLWVEPAYRNFRFGKLTKAIGLWLVILIFVSLIGVNFYHSLWSSYERMTGVVTLFHYFAFFLILISVLKTEKDWFNIFDVSIVASLAVSFIGILQKAGSLMNPTGSRIASSFGNPSFLAAYLVFNIFLILFLFYKKYPQVGWRFYYLGALFFEFLILFWTETRGALLALLIGFVLFAVLFLITPQKYSKFKGNVRLVKIIMAGILAVLIGFISFIVSIRQTPLIQKFPEIIKNMTVGSIEELTSSTTARTRLMAWEMSMKGWKEKFLFGWGWENYDVVFNKFYNPNLFPTETWFDRAHNIIFDTVTTSGLIGLLSYLSIFAVSFWILVVAFLKGKINFLTASFFSILLIAYFIQNLFVFDMIHSYLMLFLVLGFLGFLENLTLGQQASIITDSKGAKNKLEQLPSSMKVLVGVFLILVIYFINIKPGLAGFYAIGALKDAAMQKNLTFYKQDQILAKFERSLQYGTFGQWENSLRVAEYALDLSLIRDKVFEEDFKKVFNLAISAMEKTVKVNEKDARYQSTLGSLYLHGSTIDSSRLYLAEQTFIRALELNPAKQDILFILSQIKTSLGKQEEAGQLLEHAVELNPKVGQSHWTLGLYYILMGEKDKGKEEIALAGVNGYPLTIERINKLVSFYENIGAYDEIVPLYLKGIELQPSNAQLHASLAATYAKLGDKEKATAEVKKAISLDSRLQADAEQFLKELEK